MRATVSAPALARRPLTAEVTWCDPCASVKAGPLAYTQFCSLRTGRRFLTQVAQDRDLLLVVDAMPQVQDIRLRPAVLAYSHHGIEHRAEPALWVRLHGHAEFWCAADAPHWTVDRQQALREQLLPLHIGLKVFDPAALLSPGRLELATMVRRHARLGANAAQLERARLELGRLRSVGWADVLLGHHMSIHPPAVCRLVFDGLARIVPDDRVRPETRVHWIGTPASLGASPP